MKIINWNVGRPSAAKAVRILDKLKDLDGDIIILTETNSSIIPASCINSISTDFLPYDFDGELRIPYKSGENRTTIWTKYPITKTYKTVDNHTSVSADIETPFGPLTIYATIIGVFNGLRPRFKQDLQGQILDFEAILPGKKAAIIGDLNTTFSGRAYPSQFAREALKDEFEKYDLENLTASVSGAVDHIAISKEFIAGKNVQVETWDAEKSLSDHIGFSATISASHSEDV